MEFQYNALDPRRSEIRLLNLELAQDSVSCSIKHHYMDEDPLYVALSYTWGNQDFTKEILINWEIFVAHRLELHRTTIRSPKKVTVNLEAALQQLARFGIGNLWVDALCINQRDTTEKREVVRNMGKIYKKAKFVIIWLGPEADGSHAAMQFMQRHDDSAESIGYLRRYQEQGLIGCRSLAFSQEFHARCHRRRSFEDEPAATIEKSLEALFRRSYWRRVWILQEMVLARDILVVCGRDTASWKSFDKALANHPTGMRVRKSGLVPDLDKFRNAAQERVSLLKLLFLSRTALATDKRDKIYALLGIAQDGNDVVGALDYEAPSEVVYKKITVALIEKYRCLEVLALRSVDRTTDDLPSWVPDWGSLNINRPWIDYRLLDYCARQEGRPNMTVLGQTIRTRGVSLGRIDGLSSRFERFPGGDDVFSATRQPLSDPPDMYGEDFFLAQAIMESLTLGGFDLGSTHTDTMTMDPEAAIDKVHLWMLLYQSTKALDQYPRVGQWIAENLELRIVGRPLKHWMTTMPRPPPKTTKGFSHGLAMADYLTTLARDGMTYLNEEKFDKNLRALLERMNKTISYGMRLFVTDTGLIGMAHPQARAGDFIFRIEHCLIELVIRKCDQAYRIVGEVNVPTYYDGSKLGRFILEDNLEDIYIE